MKIGIIGCVAGSALAAHIAERFAERGVEVDFTPSLAPVPIEVYVRENWPEPVVAFEKPQFRGYMGYRGRRH